MKHSEKKFYWFLFLKKYYCAVNFCTIIIIITITFIIIILYNTLKYSMPPRTSFWGHYGLVIGEMVFFYLIWQFFCSKRFCKVLHLCVTCFQIMKLILECFNVHAAYFKNFASYNLFSMKIKNFDKMILLTSSFHLKMLIF